MIAPNTLLQNRYLIKRRLAQGGMGAVYIAEAVHLDNLTVAVKETFFTDDRLRQQFKREAALLARLRHPALPTVLDHFSENDGQFLVMEFIPGDDLATLLDERLEQTGEPFDWRTVMTWTDRLLDALNYIHTRTPPIIHRDIKPHNLKITPQGEIYLIDFGLSKQATTASRSGGKSVHGYTMAYAPPEQIDSRGTDERSDLYSLGATLYHLLSGKPPLDAKVREEVVKLFMPDPLQPLHIANPQIPFAVAGLVAQAMAINREQRFPSASIMRQSLKRFAVVTVVNEEAERERLRQADESRKREAEDRQRQLEAERQGEEEGRRLAEIERLEAEEMERLDRIRQRQLEEQRQRELAAQKQREEAARQQREAERRKQEERERLKTTPTVSTVSRKGTATESRNFKYLIAAAVVPIVLLAGYLLFFNNRQETINNNANSASVNRNTNTGTPTVTNPIEVLRYAVEVENVAGRTATFDLATGKRFRLHFTPQTNGFLYVLTPYAKDNKQLYVEAQSIQANRDFAIPQGNQWIPASQVKTITAVFSEKSIAELTFPANAAAVLSKEAFDRLRGGSAATTITPSATDNRVSVSEPNSVQPIIFDISFKR